MGVYDSARALALKLITAKGRLVSFVASVDGAPPDPDKPWRPGAATDDDWGTNIPAVFFDYEGMQGDPALDGVFGRMGRALVPTATEVAYVAALGTPKRPEAGEIIEDGSRSLEIVKLEVLAPGDVDVLYVLYLKE